MGGAIRKDKDFFFLYYEGQRDTQGQTQAAIVPTVPERTGDFSGLTNPSTGQFAPLINYFSGQPYSGNIIPSSQLSPIALKRRATLSETGPRHQCFQFNRDRK